MIATLHIVGLGPIANRTFVIDPAGIAEIAGPSATGKSTTIDAVCFVLWGEDRDGKPFPVDAINGDVALVEIVTKNGTTIRRSIRPNRTQTREVQKPGADAIAYRTEEAFREQLKGIGKRIDILRQIVAPMAWIPLMYGDGGGRPLRDLIATLNPGSSGRSLIAELMDAAGQFLKDADPLDPKAAELMRRDANSTKDRAGGAVQARVDGVAVANTVIPAGPSDADMVGAKAILDLAELWRRHDAEFLRVQDLRRHVDGQARAHAAWVERRDALGDRPPEPKADGSAKAVVDQREAVAAIAKRVTQLEGEIAAADRKLADAEKAGDVELTDARAKVAKYIAAYNAIDTAGDTCPTCQRPGSPTTAKRLAEGKATIATADAFREALEGNRDQREAARLGPLRDAARVARENLAEQTAALAEAKAVLVDLESKASAANAIREAFNAYDKAARALGMEPTIGTAPDLPSPPESARPDGNAFAAAKATIANAERASGAAAERERNIARAEKDLHAAQECASIATKEADRMAALVDAVRAAPSVIARQQLESLGDIAPIGLAFTDAGGVTVTVDGLPWHRASDGRKIVADMTFRAGLRRALGAGMAGIPIFVDQVQSFSGELPAIGGPVICLRTISESDAAEMAAK